MNVCLQSKRPHAPTMLSSASYRETGSSLVPERPAARNPPRETLTSYRFPGRTQGKLRSLNKRIVVAIDGPAGAGKSTLAKRLAGRLGFVYIDTGAMYRAVALWALRQGIDLTDAHALEQLSLNAEIQLTPDNRVLLNSEDVTDGIRTLEVSQAASKVSAVPAVRRALVLKQQRLGQENSVVMEGRDIGTVVFPDAQVKIYLDASPEVRAERRVQEMRLKGVECDAEETARQMRERDLRDTTRADSPLIQAPDAFYLDSSGMSLEQVEDEMLRLVRERTSNGKEVHR